MLNMFYNSPDIITSITVMNTGITSYESMFNAAATATKSSTSSNVVKGILIS